MFFVMTRIRLETPPPTTIFDEAEPPPTGKVKVGTAQILKVLLASLIRLLNFKSYRRVTVLKRSRLSPPWGTESPGDDDDDDDTGTESGKSI